jgi:hypothetical protein
MLKSMEKVQMLFMNITSSFSVIVSLVFSLFNFTVLLCITSFILYKHQMKVYQSSLSFLHKLCRLTIPQICRRKFYFLLKDLYQKKKVNIFYFLPFLFGYLIFANNVRVDISVWGTLQKKKKNCYM